MAAPPKVGLVLGAGGVMGGAWLTGGLEGPPPAARARLVEADPRRAAGAQPPPSGRDVRRLAAARRRLHRAAEGHRAARGPARLDRPPELLGRRVRLRD